MALCFTDFVQDYEMKYDLGLYYVVMNGLMIFTIVTTLVIRMIISFYRQGGGGKSALQDILGPLISQVLEDKTLHINISPVDIYKAWVNSMEFDSGKVRVQS